MVAFVVCTVVLNELNNNTIIILITFLPARIMICLDVFCLLPSQLSSGFLPYLLSPGLAISALVCLEFAFPLLSSVISFKWPHLYLVFAHVQTI